MNDKSKEVEILIDKAAKAENPDSALKFSQAACNAANAMFTIANYKTVRQVSDGNRE